MAGNLHGINTYESPPKKAIRHQTESFERRSERRKGFSTCDEILTIQGSFWTCVRSLKVLDQNEILRGDVLSEGD